MRTWFRSCCLCRRRCTFHDGTYAQSLCLHKWLDDMQCVWARDYVQEPRTKCTANVCCLSIESTRGQLHSHSHYMFAFFYSFFLHHLLLSFSFFSLPFSIRFSSAFRCAFVGVTSALCLIYSMHSMRRFALLFVYVPSVAHLPQISGSVATVNMRTRARAHK